MLLKVATPATADAVSVPPSAPGPDPRAIVIDAVDVVALPSESRTETGIAGAITAAVAVPVGCTVKPSFFGEAAVPVAVNVALAPPAEATRVLAPATVPSTQLVAAALPVVAEI